MSEPALRKPLGVLLILAWIVVWTGATIALAPNLPDNWAVEAVFFAVAGVAWIVPLKPLLKWMEKPSRE